MELWLVKSQVGRIRNDLKAQTNLPLIAQAGRAVCLLFRA